MPGLVGAVQTSSGGVRTTIETVLGAMTRGRRFSTELVVDRDDRWAIGRIHLGFLQPATQAAEAEALQVLFHGDLHNEAELRSLCGQTAARRAGDDQVSLIRALYRRFGSGFASRMQGAFCAAVVDEAAGQLVLATDLVGSYPLYWSNPSARFVFASELKAVLKDPAVRRALDPRAVSDYLWFGFLLGDKTLAEDVRLVPPASTLTYRWTTGTVVIEEYRDLSRSFRPWKGSRAEYLDMLRDAFGRAVERACSGPHRLGLSLSGGLDSRTILSAMDGARPSTVTYTLGVNGCADQVIAERLANLGGTQHRFFELDAGYLGEFLPNLRQMVSLTDGMYLSHGLTEMLAVQRLEDAGFSVLLRGHGGELAKASLAWPFHTDPRIHSMTSRHDFLPYFLDRVNYISRGVAFSELFSNSWTDRVSGGPRESLDKSVGQNALSPADLCSYLYLKEHHRRFTVPSLELFRNLFEVRLPFADPGFLEVLFQAPAAWRDGTDLHKHLIRAYHPALLSVRNSNTGAAGNAGPLREAVLDKVNTVLKRLNVYGFRHYHHFDRWMKDRLLASVDEVLLAPTAIDRGIFRESTVRTLIDRTRAGARDHSYLLQALLILELWQQENL